MGITFSRQGAESIPAGAEGRELAGRFRQLCAKAAAPAFQLAARAEAAGVHFTGGDLRKDSRRRDGLAGAVIPLTPSRALRPQDAGVPSSHGQGLKGAAVVIGLPQIIASPALQAARDRQAATVTAAGGDGGKAGAGRRRSPPLLIPAPALGIAGGIQGAGVLFPGGYQGKLPRRRHGFGIIVGTPTGDSFIPAQAAGETLPDAYLPKLGRIQTCRRAQGMIANRPAARRQSALAVLPHCYLD